MLREINQFVARMKAHIFITSGKKEPTTSLMNFIVVVVNDVVHLLLFKMVFLAKRFLGKGNGRHHFPIIRITLFFQQQESLHQPVVAIF